MLAAATLGAGPGQTLVCDTTSVNFYQLAIAAIRSRPGRKTVIIDSANFPTDRYILEGIAHDLGLTLITLDTDGQGWSRRCAGDGRTRAGYCRGAGAVSH